MRGRGSWHGHGAHRDGSPSGSLPIGKGGWRAERKCLSRLAATVYDLTGRMHDFVWDFQLGFS